ncbi:hypothetical protein C1H46_036742 [Malus baccata]|uniref:Uncharacterized protein n=1 Tax=Malus baccata TaxID=106549 RepID=A0A540KU33_MALBA|nr:hypothetical protein C1H46_036742 [Malus baccata]
MRIPHKFTITPMKTIQLVTKRPTHQKSKSTRINHQHLAMAIVTLFTLFNFAGFFFFYLHHEEIPTFENLLLALVFVAFTLFLANKNKGLINRSVSVLKHSWERMQSGAASTGSTRPTKVRSWSSGS